MSLVEHKITLDVKTIRSVEPLQLFGENDAYSISVRITDGGEEVDLSTYDLFKLEIEGVETSRHPSGTVVNNRIVFELANTLIEEGWSICDIIMKAGSTDVKTQVFQIYKQIFNAIQVDETPFRQVSQSELKKVIEIATALQGADLSSIGGLTSSDISLLHSFTQSDLAKWNSTITSVEDYRGGYELGDILVPTSDTNRVEGKTYYILRNGSYIRYNGSLEGTTCYEARQSYIDNNKLYIIPKVQDVLFNGYSLLDKDTGKAEIWTYDLLRSVQFTSNLGDTGFEYDSGRVISGTIESGETPTIPINVGVEKVKLNGDVLSIETDDNYNAVAFDAVERVSLNGAEISSPNPNINALTGLTVGSTGINASNTHPTVSLNSSNGITLTADANNSSVNIGIDTSGSSFSVPIEKLTATGAVDGNIPVYTNGGFQPRDLATALGISITQTGNTIEITDSTQRIEDFTFTDFEAVNSVDNTAMLPFLNGDNRQKITWANLINQFELYFMSRHKTVYINHTIPGSAWGTNYSIDITLDLTGTGLTTADLIGSHTHAHIHPEPDSVNDYANYGIYCSDIKAENGDTVLTFNRNTNLDGSVMPSVNITVEVRLDVENS